MSEGNFLKGLIIGGLIGAVAALLLAPKSGRETRTDICNRTEELVKRAREEYEKSLARTSEIIETVKNAADSSVSGDVHSSESGGRLAQAVAAGLKAYNEAKRE